MKTEHYILVDKEDKEVDFGAELTTFRGESVTLTGGTPPHKHGSTGRIYVTYKKDPGTTRDFFPSVCDLRWKPIFPK